MLERYDYGHSTIDRIAPHPRGGWIGELSHYGSDDVFIVWFRDEEDARALLGYAALLFQLGREFVRPRTEAIAILSWTSEFCAEDYGSAFDLILGPEWQIAPGCTPSYARYDDSSGYRLQVWADDTNQHAPYRAYMRAPNGAQARFDGDADELRAFADVIITD